MPTVALIMTSVLAGASVTASPRPPLQDGPTLADPPAFTLALLPYGGLGALASEDGIESYVLGGGTLRFTFGPVMIGGFGEASVLPNYYLNFYGGFAGAHLPFQGWVDLDAAVGFGARTYDNRARESYLGDYRVTLPAGTLRLGVSDRVGDAVGGRLGAGIVASVDVAPEERSWHIEASDVNPSGSSGSRRFGSFTLALVLTLGFDIEPGYEAEPEPERAGPGGRPPPAGDAVWPYPQ